MTQHVPDRFDKQGDELACTFQTVRCPDRRALARQIAAALRAEHEATLERAAQFVDDEDEGRTGRGFELGDVSDFRKRCVAGIRALKEPAAAPAAETGKAQVAEALPWKDVADKYILKWDAEKVTRVAAEKRITELEALLSECGEALSTVGCHPDGEALAQAVLRKLSARAAQTGGPT